MKLITLQAINPTALCTQFKRTMRYARQAQILLAVIVFWAAPQIVLGLEKAEGPTGLLFTRRNEPREQAFTILVPKGWQVEGGIFRVNPLQAGGPLNSLEAKCDMQCKSDSKGTIAFHIYPDIVYAHAGIGGGLFPAGSSYQGAEVRSMEDAGTFLLNRFSATHPSASAVRVLEKRRLSGEIEALDRSLSYTNQLLAPSMEQRQ